MRTRTSIAVLTVVAVTFMAAVAGAAPGAAAQSLTVTPNDNLHGGQTVTVTGSGFGGTGFALCLGVIDDNGPNCAILGARDASLDASGNFSSQVRIERVLNVMHSNPDSTGTEKWVDCLDVGITCAIVAYADSVGSVAVPLHFGAAPDPPTSRGTVSVLPSTGLHHLDPVTFGGAGFRTGAAVDFYLCATNPQARSDCDLFVLGSGTADAAGSVPTVTAPLPSFFHVWDGSSATVDCWRAVGACIVAAAELSDFAGTVVTKPLSYAANPGVASVSVRPDSGIIGGRDSVQVVGSGFGPDLYGEICQGAPVTGPFSLNDCGRVNQYGPIINSADITGDGALVGSLNIARDMFVPALSRWVDCTDPAETCVVYGFEVDPTDPSAQVLAGRSAMAPITLTRPPRRPRGQITASPTTNLGIFTTVNVAASGFRPDVQLDISVCTANVQTKADCDLHWSAGNRDGGNYLVQFSQGIITFFDGGHFDCNSAPNACVLAAGDTTDFAGTFATVPLDFGYQPPYIPTVVPGVGKHAEGNSGTSVLEVPVRLNEWAHKYVTVSWTTIYVPGAPGSQAEPNSDYTPASGTVTFTYGESEKTIPVVVHGDVDSENDEWFAVAFHDPVNATMGGYWGLGFGVITNDEARPAVVPGVVNRDEGDGGVTSLDIPVTLTSPSPVAVTVPWTTAYVPGAPDFQADPGADYAPASGTLTFAPGETAKSVSITVNGDASVEPDEWFVVSFHDPANATMGGYWGLGFGGILNDDT